MSYLQVQENLRIVPSITEIYSLRPLQDEKGLGIPSRE